MVHLGQTYVIICSVSWFTDLKGKQYWAKIHESALSLYELHVVYDPVVDQLILKNMLITTLHRQYHGSVLSSVVLTAFNWSNSNKSQCTGQEIV